MKEGSEIIDSSSEQIEKAQHIQLTHTHKPNKNKSSQQQQQWYVVPSRLLTFHI